MLAATTSYPPRPEWGPVEPNPRGGEEEEEEEVEEITCDGRVYEPWVDGGKVFVAQPQPLQLGDNINETLLSQQSTLPGR